MLLLNLLVFVVFLHKICANTINGDRRSAADEKQRLQTVCKDRIDFRYKNKGRKSCDWIGGFKSSTRRGLCGKEWKKYKINKYWCPATCNTCLDYVGIYDEVTDGENSDSVGEDSGSDGGDSDSDGEDSDSDGEDSDSDGEDSDSDSDIEEESDIAGDCVDRENFKTKNLSSCDEIANLTDKKKKEALCNQKKNKKKIGKFWCRAACETATCETADKEVVSLVTKRHLRSLDVFKR